MASSRSTSPARVSREATPSSPNATTTNPYLAEMLNVSGSDDDDDDEDAVFRPRGGFAARMLPKSRVAEPVFDSENDATEQPQREPESLQGGRIPGTQTQHHNPQESDADEPVTTRPRKLLSRRQRSKTPESTPQEPAADSPGLFVSPSKPQSPTNGSNPGDASDSDQDLPTVADVAKRSRLLALEAKKRCAREAKEAEEARRKAERLAAQQSFDDEMSVDEDSSISDDDGGKKLTQTQRVARPSRNASKKAMEDMKRETQRLTRSLQLAHEVKVKKKITKATLFERFNFKIPGATASTTPVAAPEVAACSSRPGSPASHRHTDAEDKADDTPPSSPPVPTQDAGAEKHVQTTISEVAAHVEDGLLLEDENGDLPTPEAVLQSSAAKRNADKGKGNETTAPPQQAGPVQAPAKTMRNLRVKLPATQVHTVSLTLDDDDDDDDLGIQPKNKSKLDALFERVPVNQAKESRSMQMLRRLAHIDDPERKGAAPVNKKSKQQDQQPSMTVGELEMTLLQRARLQAKIERDRHLELLRSKGIHVQTSEEREKEMQEVEDIVSKARKEAEELMQREREAAKADRKARKEAGGEADPLGWDDSDESDDDYQEVAPVEEPDLELSGSEEEDVREADDEDVDMDDDEEDEEAAENADPAGALFDDVAESPQASEDEEAEKEAPDQDSDEEVVTSRHPRRRAKQHTTVLSDDDEEEEEAQRHRLVEATPRAKATRPKSPATVTIESPNVPTSVLRSATKTFIPGLPVAGPAGLGLTQIFAGTMDDSQVGGSAVGSPSQPMPTFKPASNFSNIFNQATAKSQTDPDPSFGAEDFPDSNFSQTAHQVGDDMILDSQPTGKETQDRETQGVQLGFSQSQMHGFDTFLEENQDATQVSELIEPTQDGGFQNFSPLKKRFVEPPISTVDTVKLDENQQGDHPQSESPLVRRTGKLRRKTDHVSAVSAAASLRASPGPAAEEGDAMEGVDTDEFGFGTVAASANAFTALKEAAAKEKKAKAQAAFDKKKSKAREMVEEQAEESEDEYAGLGGADGEGDSDDDDQSVKEMIDDETKNNEVDERKIAAFYADRERAADEKQVDKLFHDITTGMLRRKRGGDWDDLSDSDDGGEARRRLKRRQFAKMQRALFADERISKVAENPRNQAFLRTIEEHGSDDDMDFIFAPPLPAPGVDSQDSQVSSVRQETTIPDSQPHGLASAAAAPASTTAHPRRTKGGKKPSNIGDIRESLSNLLDQPLNSSSVIPATELGSDDDDNEGDDQEPTPMSNSRPPSRSSSSTSSNKENRNPRRRARDQMIVDRITLKRNSSSTSSSASASSSTDRLAFAAAPSLASSSSGFKVPALLRRATTNNSLNSMTGGSATSNTASSAASNKNNNGSGGSDSGSVFGEDAKIKKTTTTSKRSGINYFARENERRAVLAENERRREARKWKGAEGRSKVVGGLFGAGKFE